LVGNAAADHPRIHTGSHLLLDLGLGKPNRLGGLQSRCGRLQLLQASKPINPNRVRFRTAIVEIST